MSHRTELLRYQELIKYVDEQFGTNERMALLTHLLNTVDHKALIPAKGWNLTEQGGTRDVLTVNVFGSVANKHAAGTISFYEIKMPRSKLGDSLFLDMSNAETPPAADPIIWEDDPIERRMEKKATCHTVMRNGMCSVCNEQIMGALPFEWRPRDA